MFVLKNDVNVPVVAFLSFFFGGLYVLGEFTV